MNAHFTDAQSSRDTLTSFSFFSNDLTILVRSISFYKMPVVSREIGGRSSTNWKNAGSKPKVSLACRLDTETSCTLLCISYEPRVAPYG